MYWGFWVFGFLAAVVIYLFWTLDEKQQAKRYIKRDYLKKKTALLRADERYQDMLQKLLGHLMQEDLGPEQWEEFLPDCGAIDREYEITQNDLVGLLNRAECLGRPIAETFRFRMIWRLAHIVELSIKKAERWRLAEEYNLMYRRLFELFDDPAGTPVKTWREHEKICEFLDGRIRQTFDEETVSRYFVSLTDLLNKMR